MVFSAQFLPPLNGNSGALMASMSSGSRWPVAKVGRCKWRVLRLTAHRDRRMFGAMAITNELLLEQMKALRDEITALTRQNRELRDRLTEVHAAVTARKTRDEAQVTGEETRKIHPCAEREAIGSDRPPTPETRQDREQNERCWWNELPGTERERLEAEIRARPYEPVRGLDGEVLVAAISDLEVIRIAWEEAHPDRPRWPKLPEESFRNRYPRSDPCCGRFAAQRRDPVDGSRQ